MSNIEYAYIMMKIKNTGFINSMKGKLNERI